MSPAMLKSRFSKLLKSLSLTPGLVPGVRDFDLGSLRAGGATMADGHHGEPRHDSPSGAVDIHQEVAALEYLPRLPEQIKTNIFDWVNNFESALQFAENCIRCQFNPSTWHYLLSQGVGMR